MSPTAWSFCIRILLLDFQPRLGGRFAFAAVVMLMMKPHNVNNTWSEKKLVLKNVLCSCLKVFDVKIFDPTLSGQSYPAIFVVDLLDDGADAAAAGDPESGSLEKSERRKRQLRHRLGLRIHREKLVLQASQCNKCLDLLFVPGPSSSRWCAWACLVRLNKWSVID